MQPPSRSPSSTGSARRLTADSYIGQISRTSFPGMPWEEFDHFWQRSPLSLVGNMVTPTLLITGEEDYRTPISETEQLYQALKLKQRGYRHDPRPGFVAWYRRAPVAPCGKGRQHPRLVRALSDGPGKPPMNKFAGVLHGDRQLFSPAASLVPSPSWPNTSRIDLLIENGQVA